MKHPYRYREKSKKPTVKSRQASLFTMLKDASMPVCYVCGNPRAHFGYGPPLTPKPFAVCMAHRAEGEKLCQDGLK